MTLCHVARFPPQRVNQCLCNQSISAASACDRCANGPRTGPPCPKTFFDEVLSKWLQRSSVLRHAEVRNTGSGLHLLLNLDEPIEFTSSAIRDRWDCKIRLLQSCLPIDPDQPSITAFTRPINSTNSKNGHRVERLAEGQPVSRDDLDKLVDEMIRRPFATVFQMLNGEERMAPCPICKRPETELSAMSKQGRYYGSCGDVSLQRLYELLLQPRQSPRTGGSNE